MENILSLNTSDKKETGSEMVLKNTDGKPFVIESCKATYDDKGNSLTEDKPVTLLLAGIGSKRGISIGLHIPTAEKVINNNKKYSENKREELKIELLHKGTARFILGWENAGIDFSQEHAEAFALGFRELKDQINAHVGNSNNYLK